ncbi:MAG: MFS transporter [Chloroflexi bacterium]|nr:MFS transporter [Chloroflexota bacterium]
MSDGGDEGGRRNPLDYGKGMVTGAGAGADRILDEAQRHVFRFLWLFLPEPEIARNLRFQHLLASRFLSDAGQQSVVFGALIAVARGGGSAIEVASVGVAGLLPPALLGLYGGAIADTLPKRVALAGTYASQAALCFVLPTVFGTDLWLVLILIFSVNSLGQVSGPTESAVVPLVATEKQLASAVSMIGLAAAAGAAFGTALLAPILVRTAGETQVFYAGGALLLLASSRAFDLPVWDKKEWKLTLQPRNVRARAMVTWLVRHPAVGTMVVVSVMAATVNVTLGVLAPQYVESVLDSDAANTAYIFGPSALGVVLALVVAPSLIKQMGERWPALIGLLIAATALFCLGIPGEIGTVVDQVNPIRLLGTIGIDLSQKLRTAALLAMPLAFGVSLTAAAVQTYINRQVPMALQGRTFALQGAVRNGAAIFPLVTMGAAATLVGADTVLLASPILLVVVAYGLILASSRVAGVPTPSRLEVVESFWEEPELDDSG